MKKIIGWISTITFILLLVGAVVFQQDIRDWLKLRGYVPPAEIVALADDTSMLGNARRLFYVQHPLLADKNTFNEYCRNGEETIVLGCYIHGQGIYLLDVTDERITGVEEVTAAHELLHAAYERLSSKERSRIDTLTNKAFNELQDDRIRQTIEVYRQKDPAIVPNELHSILGTEVRVLPQELEEYYARYFSDRAQVVTLSEQYEQVFIERQNAIRTFDEQLKSLKAAIDALQAELLAEEARLTSERNQLNAYKASGQIASYNQLVPSYNKKVNEYNKGIESLESQIATYNDIVQRRNDVAAEEAELVEAIDSRDVVPAQQ